MTPPRISIAIPLHDEEPIFPELLDRVTAVLDALPGGPHEIVLVDDGSVDRTFELVSAAAGIFSFSVTPLRAAWILGAIASGMASVYALWAIFQRLFLGTSPQGFTAPIVAITFFAGIQLLFLGLIGEYVGRVYDQTKSRPHFVVTEVVRGGESGATSPDV